MPFRFFKPFVGTPHEEAFGLAVKQLFRLFFGLPLRAEVEEDGVGLAVLLLERDELPGLASRGETGCFDLPHDVGDD
jgi:hypothetical protein